MTEYVIKSPCSPGDTVWAIVGDQVKECKVEKVAIYASETACSICLTICFVEPNIFANGQMKTYDDYAILGRRKPYFRAAYPTQEEAEQALAAEGPDYK